MAYWIRKILRLVGPPKQRENHKPLASYDKIPRSLILLDLPLDILMLMIRDLPLVSQACLALTCKPLYRLLHSVLDDEQLAWPRYLATPLPSHGSFDTDPDLPRNDLLLKLEDSHWLYCVACLKLHPKSQFFLYEELTPPSSRHCRFLFGVVDLCACLAVTYLDGVKLANWMRTGEPNQYLHQNIRQNFELQVLSGDRCCLVHNCCVTSQPDIFVNLKTMVTVNAENSLVVTTRYNLHLSTPLVLDDYSHGFDSSKAFRMPPGIESVFLCPHTHALGWIYKKYSIHPYMNFKDECISCDAEFCFLGHTGDRLRVVIQGVRNLGSVLRTMPNGEDRCSWDLDAFCCWWSNARKPGNAMEHLWYKKC